MRIHTIFEVVNPNLCSAKFEYEERDMLAGTWDHWERNNAFEDEVEKAFDNWGDAIFLRAFFNQFRRDLTAHSTGMSVTEAARLTWENALDFKDELVAAFRGDDPQRIANMFWPLDNREEEDMQYTLQHIKGKHAAGVNWLRLYGVRYEDQIVITGSAIKLTPRMNTRPHLTRELHKMDVAAEYLSRQGHNVTFVYKPI